MSEASPQTRKLAGGIARATAAVVAFSASFYDPEMKRAMADKLDRSPATRIGKRRSKFMQLFRPADQKRADARRAFRDGIRDWIAIRKRINRTLPASRRLCVKPKKLRRCGPKLPA